MNATGSCRRRAGLRSGATPPTDLGPAPPLRDAAVEGGHGVRPASLWLVPRSTRPRTGLQQAEADHGVPIHGWIADRIGDWVKKNPGVGAKDARAKLEYNKAWYGMKVALDQIHGSYEDSFPLLFNWKAEIEQKSLGSIVEIELLKKAIDTTSTECSLHLSLASMVS